ncbi:MAG: hypothetical protein KC609_16990 [Myxococcales bacterium]|nr:hypothetical protein [Myxococcales bacterium]
MKKILIMLFCVAGLALAPAGCSKKKECMDKCEKAVKDAESKCPKDGPAADACKKTIKSSMEACKKACDKQ